MLRIETDASYNNWPEWDKADQIEDACLGHVDNCRTQQNRQFLLQALNLELSPMSQLRVLHEGLLVGADTSLAWMKTTRAVCKKQLA